MRNTVSGRLMLSLTLLLGILLMVATVNALAGDPALQSGPSTDARPSATPTFDEPDINNPDHPPLLGGAPVDRIVTTQESSLDVPSLNFQSAVNAPVITVWHSQNFNFGANGDPQKWVNILGNVNSGAFPLISLSYTLNGAFGGNLNRGPDERRLTAPGDFLIEIDYSDLVPGNNQVVISATDSNNVTTTAPITVVYTDGGNSWAAQTYTYDWTGLTSINPKAQVVTGLWTIDGSTVRPTVFEYDRLLALGDLSWKDYTVTVPITVYAIDESGYDAPSFGPAVGLIVRWQGHFNNDTASQPNLGWRRLGALGWYHWYKEGGQTLAGFQFLGHTGANWGEDTRQLVFGKTYNYKLNVQSNPDPIKPSTYRFKVWDAALTEPAAWDFTSVGHPDETKNGSVLLVAHHVDAKFGAVTVKLDSVAAPPTLTTSVSGTGSGTIGLVPNKTTFRFGEDANLTANPAIGSQFTGWVGDVEEDETNGNKATLEMMTSRTVGAVFTDPNKVTPVSDDFSACALDTGLWTFVNPLSDATLTMTGNQAQIAIPAGTSHDYWTSGRTAPRLMQFVEDADFSFDVKFESPLSQKTQIQGVVVEQDDKNWLRYSFQWDGNDYKLLAHTRTSGGSAAKLISDTVVVTPPMYLRVQRAGDNWTLRYSNDGQTWTTATTYAHAIDVNSVGVFAGNVGANAPATTVLVDYFFNTNSPIVPEDGANQQLTLQVATQGQGTVAVSPLKPTYSCGESVTLTANPVTGWKLGEWQGDATGNEPVKVIAMTKSKSVTAVFVPDVQVTLTTTTNGNGSVIRDPNKAAYSVGEAVKLTAQADLGYAFVNWSGDLTSTTNPVTVTMDSNKTINAGFAKAPDRTLTTSVPGGGGTILVTPPNDSPYLNGSVVTLTPVPDSGFSFVGWGGDLAGETTAPYQLVMDADKNVTATFAQANLTLTVNANPSAGGSVTVTPQKTFYASGEVVELEATPSPGYIFLNWTGVTNSTSNPVEVTMTESKTITANFVTVGEFTLTTAANGPGQVLANPTQPSYGFGDVVTLTATADAGYAFIGWSGDLAGTENPAALTITKDSVVTATFTQDNLYTLAVTPVGPGSVTIDPARAAYAQDQLVTLTAVPQVGYRFAGWSGDHGGTANPATVKMTKNTAIIATFEEAIPVDLTVTVDPPSGGTVTLSPDKEEYLMGEVVTMTAKAAQGFTFSGWQGDAEGNSTTVELLMDGDKTVVATFTNQPGVVSDDFNSCALDPVLWEWIDPTAAAQYEMNGTQLTLFIPPGENYNIGDGGNFAARMMQYIPNTDLTIEVKMDSGVFQQYQNQGILVEQDDNNYIYFQIFHNGTEVRAHSGSVSDGVFSSRFSEAVPAADESYLRVTRTGDNWRMWHSLDGQNWNAIGRTIRKVINVDSAGLFAGSHSRSAGAQPGHEAVFDYFFDFNSPVDPEDPAPPFINTSVVGSGTITRSPEKTVYACGEEVTLTANPADNWAFAGWSGDVSGSSPSVVLLVTGVHDVIATFTSGTIDDDYMIHLPAVLR